MIPAAWAARATARSPPRGSKRREAAVGQIMKGSRVALPSTVVAVESAAILRSTSQVSS